VESLPLMIRTSLLLGFLLALSGCGAGAPCQSACDCTATTAPIKCPGEWGCNASNTCEYSCKNLCDPNGVSTCRVDEECLGTFCSARKACQ